LAVDSKKSCQAPEKKISSNPLIPKEKAPPIWRVIAPNPLK
jgi:hypothetical protein